MARHDVYENTAGQGYLLDVQADLLESLSTRIVVPLLPRKTAPLPAERLNPVFSIDDVDHIMATQFLAAVPTSILGQKVTSLQQDHDTIVVALDMAFQGS